ncbi:P-loop NTPase fold protein [Paenibacillus tarimensis]
MEISINHKIISDAPYNGENQDIFVFDNKELISQIKQEILNGTPTCYLVSGYRGVGKTSFIKRVEQETKEENSQIVFIKLNISKYEDYSMLLRKIIREVYLSISDTHNINELRKQNKEIITSLELLYERTFHEVIGSQKNSIKHEDLSLKNIQINIKKLIALLITLLLAGLNIKFNLIDWLFNLKNNKYIDLILFFILGLWSALESIKINRKINQNKTDISEISRKTLYDDEIAEYQLNRTLKNLNQIKVIPIFIIDELDKIDELENVEKLIAELKPLMLSGLASFILVSGQNLYYKFHTAHIHDDALIASIFSKSVHIPLLTTKEFIDLFSKVLNNSNLVNNRSVNYFVKSKVLNSNRLPRRFLNLIRQNLIWKENKSFIEVSEEDEQAYITDSKLLDIIDHYKDNELLAAGYSEGIVDFFISQLHIWIQKMKLKGTSYFNKEDIYDIEKDYKVTHPSWYFTRLNSLIISLLEELHESGLLEKKNQTTDDGEEIAYYKWTNQATIKTETLINENEELQSAFLMNFIELEKYIREIYFDVTSEKQTKHSIRQMVNKLTEIELLPTWWIEKNQVNYLTQLRNKIVHGETISLDEIDFLQNYAFEINRIKSQLIEEYTFFITKQYLESHQYSVTKDITVPSTSYVPSYDRRYDFVAFNQLTNHPDILFIVKMINTTNNSSRKELLYKSIESLMEYNNNSRKSNLMVFLIYAKNGRKIYDQFEETLEYILKNDFPQLKNYVFSFFNSEYRGDANQSRLKKYLEKLMSKI